MSAFSHLLLFTVEGLPIPKGSARAFRHNKSGRVIVHADNRAKLKPWETSVRAAAMQAIGREFQIWRRELPIRLDVVFALPQPAEGRTRRAHPTVKPDLSKLVRGIEDALSGVVFVDDAQITEISATKLYLERGTAPYARLVLSVVGAS